jgi:hypothetical protein
MQVHTCIEKAVWQMEEMMRTGLGFGFWGEIAARRKTAGLFAGWTCRKLRVSP